MSKEVVFEDYEMEEETDFSYDLTPYNFNMDVEGLLRRFVDNDILIPSFQRNYVWDQAGASMFIDSVLRGLPTPSLFFYEEKSKKYLVIDGQQRLLTLYYFIRGIFPTKKQHQNINVNPNVFDIDFSKVEKREDSIKGIPFKLIGKNIYSQWKNKTFSELTSEQQKRIRNTYIYIIDLKQTSPSDDNSSMYLVYERINTGSTRLNAQQIRLCVSHGEYAQYLCEKAIDYRWEKTFKINDKSSGISELILRFISLYYSTGIFKGSMKNFLDKELKLNKDFKAHSMEEITWLFDTSFSIITNLFTEKTFTPKQSFNSYFFLVTWVSIANVLSHETDPDDWIKNNKKRITEKFNKVCKDEIINSFITNTRRASNSETLSNVINILTTAFKDAINE